MNTIPGIRALWPSETGRNSVRAAAVTGRWKAAPPQTGLRPASVAVPE